MQTDKVGPIHLSRIVTYQSFFHSCQLWKERTTRLISEEQKNVLKKYHEKGIKSTRREMGSKIRECAFFGFIVGDLVGKAGQKMPYVRAGQMGIVFKDFPNTLEKEFGIDPRKPHLYGSAQRRKFALSRSIFSQSSTSSDGSSASSTSQLYILRSEKRPEIYNFIKWPGT
ncbi:uncharacterized protein LOC144632118 [Oculina patagonica]